MELVIVDVSSACKDSIVGVSVGASVHEVVVSVTTGGSVLTASSVIASEPAPVIKFGIKAESLGLAVATGVDVTVASEVPIT